MVAMVALMIAVARTTSRIMAMAITTTVITAIGVPKRKQPTEWHDDFIYGKRLVEVYPREPLLFFSLPSPDARVLLTLHTPRAPRNIRPFFSPFSPFLLLFNSP